MKIKIEYNLPDDAEQFEAWKRLEDNQYFIDALFKMLRQIEKGTYKPQTVEELTNTIYNLNDRILS